MIFAAAVVATACSKSIKHPAPVQDGSYLKYAVAKEVADTTIRYEIKVVFSAAGNAWDIDFRSSDAAYTAEPVRTDLALMPKDRVIQGLSLGRLWLDPDSRRIGSVGPCGRVTKERPYEGFQTWELHGACTMNVGQRFFDSETGFLVGYLFGSESAKLIASNLVAGVDG